MSSYRRSIDSRAKYHTTPETLVEEAKAWQQQLDDLQSVMSPEAMAKIEQAYQNLQKPKRWMTVASQCHDVS